ncbi:MAG: T9SS type A sorting domain-containing protein [Saprospiraceae bacterium]|jgi:hypothetical protein|nr:T9SS type A sorting domain-containing protein [Saprospiraceae bacterium]
MQNHKLVPNPAHDRTWVNFETAFVGSIELIGADGKLLSSQVVDAPSTSIGLDTRPLLPGLYFVRAVAEGSRQYQYGRLVIVR